MKEKCCYVALDIEIMLYPNEDVVRTSNVVYEVGGGWDSEGWGE